MCAALTTATAFGWQALVVHYSYDAKWTGLFCIGERSNVPPELDHPGLYRFPGSPGHDGQFYYLIAHDPLARRGFGPYVDNPSLRWRRILVPALAYTLAAGRPEAIPAAYVAIVLASVFLGSYWLSTFCARAGWSPLGGALFLTIPAVAVTLDRMTVDAPLAALCIGFALHGSRKPSRKTYAILAAAPLIRETGLVLHAAFCLRQTIDRRFREAGLGMITALPWLAWEVFLRLRLPADGTSWTSPVPLRGLVGRTLNPIQFEITSAWLGLAALLDNVALTGIWVALALTLGLAWRRKTALLHLSCIVFLGAVMFVAKEDVWADAYAFGRTLSPLLIWTGLMGVESRRGWYLLPWALNIPRIALQIATVSLPFLRALTGSLRL